jgi:hypothetical protein
MPTTVFRLHLYFKGGHITRAFYATRSQAEAAAITATREHPDTVVAWTLTAIPTVDLLPKVA